MLSALSAWGRHMKGLALHGFGERLRPLVWGGAACLLLAPGVAMQLGADGVHWTAADFVVMGLLLAAAPAAAQNPADHSSHAAPIASVAAGAP